MIRVIETDFPVGDGRPDLVTRFRFRADRFARRRNQERLLPSYRYEVFRKDGRWVVIAMQNVAVSE